ncbi:MAG TPA: response regulator transcription factor [Verrucomicrobiae bacterium]|nr:response regulator transcription factor [Verrucomicrobiae bacterium]
MKKSLIRILLIDDHYMVRIGLKAILSLEPGFCVAGESEDGASGIELFRKCVPDVTLMDLRMPGMDGVEATAAILRDFPEAKIIMLTTFDGDEDVYRGLKSGAKGYVLKRVRGDELVRAIKTVYAGGRYLSREAERRLAEHSPGSELTQREREVLQYVAKGLNNKEIGNLVGCTRFTVKFHVQNILQKMGVADRTEAVAAAMQRGILRAD